MKLIKKNVIQVEQKKCYVFDNFITPQKTKMILEGAQGLKFGRYLATILPSGTKGYAWMLNLKSNQTSSIIERVREVVMKSYGVKEAHLCRMYIHCLSHSDVTQPHRDCKKHENGDFTAVIYLNPEWQKSWGGELILFENKEASRAISLKPGRLVLFPGNIEHTATAPAAHAQEIRYSWVLKFTDKLSKKRLFDRDLAKFDDSFEVLDQIR